MSDQDYEQFDSDILNAISESLIRDKEAQNPIVTGYVVVAEWTDDDGSPRFFGCGMRGQTASRSVGMIVYGEEHERELMRRNIREEWDDV